MIADVIADTSVYGNRLRSSTRVQGTGSGYASGSYRPK